MKYFSIYRIHALHRLADAPADAVKGWVLLMSYAASDEHESPRLVGAASWSDRLWLRTCGLDSSEVEPVVAAGLARREGDDVVVELFDETGLAALQKKRAQGAHGKDGGAGAHKKKAKAKGNPQGKAEAKPEGNPIGLDQGGSEGIGEEEIGGEGTPSASAPAGAVPPSPAGAQAPWEPEPENSQPDAELTAKALVEIFSRAWEAEHGAAYVATTRDEEGIRDRGAGALSLSAADWQVVCGRYVHDHRAYPTERGHALWILLDDLNKYRYREPFPPQSRGKQQIPAAPASGQQRPGLDLKRRSELRAWSHTGPSVDLYERDPAEWRRRVGELHPAGGAPPDDDERLHEAIAKAIRAEAA